ncbi:MAG: VOC family protein [Ilumatobacteraceae bacterium]
MNIPELQIAVDAEDPHLLNRFWAAAFGYETEDHHEMIEGIIAAGHATVDDTVEIDGRRAWKQAATSRDPDGRGPRLLFQQVPEAKTVKNRVHLDLHVAEGTRAAEVERLLGLGATKLWDGSQGPQVWVTLADPEGNEFCVG